MSKDADREWQLQLTALVAEVKANQENLAEKVDSYAKESSARTDKLEHVVFGKGEPGLAEEVRGLKGKWAILYGAVIVVLSAVVNGAAKALFGN